MTGSAKTLQIVEVALQSSIASRGLNVIDVFRCDDPAAGLAVPAKRFASKLSRPNTISPFARLAKLAIDGVRIFARVAGQFAPRLISSRRFAISSCAMLR